MRKPIFVLLLTIISSVQLMSEELFFTRDSIDPDKYYQLVYSGVLKKGDHPKLYDYYSPHQTILFSTNGTTYYLCYSDPSILSQLQALGNHLNEAADIYGYYYHRPAYDYNFNEIGFYDFIRVDSISLSTVRLPSLCDEWNVLVTSYSNGLPVSKTIKHQLTEDTLIGNHRYRKHICGEYGYLGAIREGTDRDIYYVTKGKRGEYPIYGFNKTDSSGYGLYWNAEGHGYCSASIQNVTEDFPRIFTLDLKSLMGEYLYTTYWIEGVGFPEGPTGRNWPKLNCEESCSSQLLCAYKEGEQVYTSFLGDIIGCEYSGSGPYICTIPLYAGDGPGTSTVDPIDPNLIVAYLQNNLLIIKEFVGVEFYYALTNGLNPLMQARGRTPQQQQSFRNEVSIPLTEPGVYTIELTSAEWDYAITGTFTYMPEGIETVSGQSPVTKILRNGQLHILRNGKMYTPTGQKVGRTDEKSTDQGRP